MRTSTLSPQSTRRPAVVLAAIALGIAAVDIVAGASMWAATASSTSEDPLTGIGYVVAVVVGAPGVLGGVLGGLGWRFADREAGLGLGIAGVVITAMTLLPAGWLLVSSLWPGSAVV